eukprot:scaffold2428_cov412-Prasinococcus_capsulatus_cf.AAC.5
MPVPSKAISCGGGMTGRYAYPALRVRVLLSRRVGRPQTVTAGSEGATDGSVRAASTGGLGRYRLPPRRAGRPVRELLAAANILSRPGGAGRQGREGHRAYHTG